MRESILTVRCDPITRTIVICNRPVPSLPESRMWDDCAHILSQFAVGHGGRNFEDGWHFSFEVEDYISCVRWFGWHNQWRVIGEQPVEHRR